MIEPLLSFFPEPVMHLISRPSLGTRIFRAWTFLVVLFSLSLALPQPAHAEDSDWLVGRWELSFDTDGNVKDYLEFSANGQVNSIGPRGRKRAGMYRVETQQVIASFPLQNGKVYKAVLLRDSKHIDQLKLQQRKATSVTIYRKVRNPR
jgi:hypothetical protein